MSRIAVVVGTFGASTWTERALRAAESVQGAQTFVWHGRTLSQARNYGAELASEAEYLCFLDADDELDPGFIPAMEAELDEHHDIYQPATLGVVDGVEDEAPVLIPEIDMSLTNYLVVSSVVRRSVFDQVGGFHEFTALEDWDLWLRCIEAGATVKQVPDAILRVTVRAESRNQNTKAHRRAYAQIRQQHRAFRGPVVRRPDGSRP